MRYRLSTLTAEELVRKEQSSNRTIIVVLLLMIALAIIAAGLLVWIIVNIPRLITLEGYWFDWLAMAMSVVAFMALVVNFTVLVFAVRSSKHARAELERRRQES